MIIKRKITTLTTDSNGQATYRYDSAGIGDITFAVDFKGNDSSVVSKIYSIIDGIFLDRATSSDYNTVWLFRNCTDSIRTRDATGTLLDVTNTTLKASANVVPNTNNFYANYIPKNTCIEFDVLDVDTSDRVEFTALTRRASSSVHPAIVLNKYTAPYHVKIELGETTVKMYVDNNLIVSKEYDDIIEYRAYFAFPVGGGKYVKYSNFVIYPV